VVEALTKLVGKREHCRIFVKIDTFRTENNVFLPTVLAGKVMRLVMSVRLSVLLFPLFIAFERTDI